MLVNLLLLRGNIGKPGAGICPVRGHSNVQGQRTVGITEKPELVPLDKLARAVRLRAAARKGPEHGRGLRGDPRRRGAGLHRPRRQFRARRSRPRPHGAGLAQAAAHRAGRDQAQPQPSDPRRGRLSAALPRPHRDRPAGDRPASRCRSRTAPAASTARSACSRRPAPHLLSEPAIVAGIAKATLAAQSEGRLGRLGRRLRQVREAIEETYPEIFHDFNARMWQPGGFHRPLAGAAARVEDQDRQGQLHRSRAVSNRSRRDRRPTATCCG